MLRPCFSWWAPLHMAPLYSLGSQQTHPGHRLPNNPTEASRYTQPTEEILLEFLALVASGNCVARPHGTTTSPHGTETMEKQFFADYYLDMAQTAG